MSVKATIVLSEEHPQFHAALRRRGMHTLAVRRCDLLDSPVASHADMQLLALDTKTVLLSPYQPQLKAQLSQLGLTVLTGPALEKEYPRDVPYNALRLENHYICNHKTVSAVARSYWQKLGCREIAVKQGYASCSTCVVDEQSTPGLSEPQPLRACAFCRFDQDLSKSPNTTPDSSAAAVAGPMTR